VIRFVHFFHYAKPMSVNDGEAWYMRKHVPRVRELPGVRRYISWRTEEGVPLGSDPDSLMRYVRRTDLYFDTLDEGRNAILGQPDIWTPAPEGEAGFGEFECMFIEDKPQFDLLRDVPVQQYRYLGNPLNFTGGEPQWLDDDDALLWIYFFNYRSDISEADGKEWIEAGEDWYLGHHVREGKIMKQLGKRHYLTWLTRRFATEPDSPLVLDRWYRLTELGVPQGMHYWGNRNAAPQMTGPAGGGPTRGPGGYGEFRNLVIDPEGVQDLMA
jgi:hypothetical protein